MWEEFEYFEDEDVLDYKPDQAEDDEWKAQAVKQALSARPVQNVNNAKGGLKMIADDLKDTLKELSNEDLMAIIGYCEGMIDCRNSADEE